MKRIRVKIVAVVVLVLAAGVLVKVFWPTRTQDVPPPELQKSELAEDEKESQEAERLYQMAALQKERAGPSAEGDYMMVVASCRQILERYPDSPQAEKARELLREVPEQLKKAYDREMSIVFPSKPKVKKSRALRRRRIPRRYYERPGITIEEPAPSS
ncbi:MAG: hypothetical protein ACYST6_12265 [Planctomycetota bacterium]